MTRMAVCHDGGEGPDCPPKYMLWKHLEMAAHKLMGVSASTLTQMDGATRWDPKYVFEMTSFDRMRVGPAMRITRGDIIGAVRDACGEDGEETAVYLENAGRLWDVMHSTELMRDGDARLAVLADVLSYFKDWESAAEGQPQLTGPQKNRTLIPRTCL